MGNAHSDQLSEHIMTAKKTTPRPARKAAPQKPKRVELVNTDRRNGVIGEIARPLEKDIDAWLGKGWKRVEKSAGSAE